MVLRVSCAHHDVLPGDLVVFPVARAHHPEKKISTNIFFAENNLLWYKFRLSIHSCWSNTKCRQFIRLGGNFEVVFHFSANQRTSNLVRVPSCFVLFYRNYSGGCGSPAPHHLTLKQQWRGVRWGLLQSFFAKKFYRSWKLRIYVLALSLKIQTTDHQLTMSKYFPSWITGHFAVWILIQYRASQTCNAALIICPGSCQEPINDEQNIQPAWLTSKS